MPTRGLCAVANASADYCAITSAKPRKTNASKFMYSTGYQRSFWPSSPSCCLRGAALERRVGRPPQIFPIYFRWRRSAETPLRKQNSRIGLSDPAAGTASTLHLLQRSLSSIGCAQPVILGAAEAAAIGALVGEVESAVGRTDEIGERRPAGCQVGGVIHLVSDVRRRAPGKAEFLFQLHQRSGINDRCDRKCRTHFHHRVGIPGGHSVINKNRAVGDACERLDQIRCIDRTTGVGRGLRRGGTVGAGG